MQFLNMFFFDIYPYIAGAVFLIGSWLRYDYGSTHGVRRPARCWIAKG
ncbi:respiratory nitrate reductase 1 subunit gamma [Escherichia coli]|uniref:Respiratory nitrate reductase 1 subunit gamma n=1 Tax=Escherichia coli TaxID=562 RepID=A0A484X9R7_ECOLX|nr:respiratory nitrate reductase 1 subunit gamma [Escherichia coli]